MAIKVIGIGNDFRGDDVLGLKVIRALKRDLTLKDIEFFEKSGEGTSLMSTWSQQDEVYLVDAFDMSDKLCGELLIFDALKDLDTIDALQNARCSTHDFGVREALLLSKELGTLPKTLKVYGCVAKNFAFANALSSELETSTTKLIENLKVDLLRTS